MQTRLFKIIGNNKLYLVYLPLGVFWATIFVLSSIPSPGSLPTFHLGDKVDHFAAYLVLSVLLFFALLFQERFRNFRGKEASLTFMVAFFYGVFDEIHQIFIPGRYFDLLDLLANLGGILVGISLVRGFFSKELNRLN